MRICTFRFYVNHETRLKHQKAIIQTKCHDLTFLCFAYLGTCLLLSPAAFFAVFTLSINCHTSRLGSYQNKSLSLHALLPCIFCFDVAKLVLYFTYSKYLAKKVIFLTIIHLTKDILTTNK